MCFKLLGVALALYGLEGCSPATVSSPSSKCAKSTSVTTLKPVQTLSYQNNRTRGGYLVAYHTPKFGKWDGQDSSLIASYCAVVIEKELSDPNQIALWTASHCLDFSRIVKVELLRYQSAVGVNSFGEFKLEDTLSPVTAEMRSIRSMIAGYSDAVAEEILSVFSTSTARIGTTRCKDFTANHFRADYQQICSSLDDMEMVRLLVPGTPYRTVDQQNLMDELNAIPLTQDATMLDKAKQWQAAYSTLAERRWALFYSRLSDKVASCAAKPQQEFCANKESIVNFLKTVTSTNVGTQVSNASSAAAAFANQKVVIRELWKNALAGDIGKSPEGITVDGVFHFDSSLSSTAVLSGTTVAANTAFMGIPLVFGMSSADVSSSVVDKSEQEILVSRPRAGIKLSFSFGDSGSLFSLRPTADSFLPLGVVSTVDGEPTSGGLPYLPSANEASDEAADAQGVPNAGSGGC